MEKYKHMPFSQLDMLKVRFWCNDLTTEEIKHCESSGGWNWYPSVEGMRLLVACGTRKSSDTKVGRPKLELTKEETEARMEKQRQRAREYYWKKKALKAQQEAETLHTDASVSSS
jgi:hypothetical protein